MCSNSKLKMTESNQYEVNCHEERKTIMLANFTNGSVVSTKAESLKVGCFQSEETEPKKQKRKILVAETDKLNYIGQTFGQYACQAATASKNYVGILDRRTGKMKICDALMFKMHPKSPGQIEEERVPPIALPGDSADLSYRDKNDLLTEAFGSKKKKSAMESRYRNKVEDETLEKSLSSSIEKAMLQELTPPTRETEDSAVSTIPPYNKDASRPEDVYKLLDIISDIEMDALTNNAKEFFDSDSSKIKGWKTESKYPLFVLNHLSTLPQEEESRWRRAKCLLYLNYLIELFNMKPSDLRRKNPFPDAWPKPVMNQLRNKFTLLVQTNSGKGSCRCMPARLKDKLVSHILVLALILDECTLEISDLQTDLKIGSKRLVTHFKALGCVVKVQKETLANGETLYCRLAVLKVPLVFPEITVKSKKDRR